MKAQGSTVEKKRPKKAAAPSLSISGKEGEAGALRLFSGNANRPLSEEIAAYLGSELCKTEVGRFADGEINVQIHENVRGKDCYVIQPTCRPANENLMELLIMIDALTRASAGRITAVIPYYGYARADRKSAPRVPITAKLVANLITEAGAHRVITVDLHAGQIQGFFDIPLDNIFAMPIVLEYFRAKKLDNIVVVSPDVGGVERARAFAKRLKAGLAIVDKRRPRPNEASIYNVIGDVKGMNAIIIDDMVDTGGTLTKVANKIWELGANRVFASCVHGVLSASAVDLVAKSSLEELVLSDSIPPRGQESEKITRLSIAPILGEAILRNHRGESISELFV
ncbi:MAG: phosphoribosylpyrophosphate synthetase [Elusimicrobia bacterium]|nr:MAG: phosphoribosylpyrophosphate synthetase [Elusimicrobiota bacterium]